MSSVERDSLEVTLYMKITITYLLILTNRVRMNNVKGVICSERERHLDLALIAEGVDSHYEY